MERYINADLFKKNIKPVWYQPDELEDNGYCGLYDSKDIADMIDAQPTADVQEVIHGHWLKQNNSSYSPFDGSPPNWYICSVCGRREEKAEPYCNCGAKMDEEVINGSPV